MENSIKEENVFAGIRVLELAGELGAYTGKLFADLGAEVIRIEPPTGDSVRTEKPCIKGAPDLEKSIRYQYLNTNKKGIAVDITTSEGKGIFPRLVKTADLLIESYPPDYLEKLGFGYEQLIMVNPKLVHTAITPYGQDGPYKDYPYSDLTCLAMGGMLYLAGLDSEKPARAPDKQSYLQAELYAAYASIVALYHANLTGEGQFIDVSIQECVATALENAIQAYDLEGRIRRAAGGQEAGYGTYCCQDGYVFMMAAMGRNTYLWDPLVSWLIEEKIPDAAVLAGEEWRNPDYRRKEEAKATFKRIFELFSMKYTKQELYEKSQKRSVVIYPVNTPKDVLDNAQLKDRHFYKEVDVPLLGKKVCYPGAPYYLEKINWELRTPAPAFGQDTMRIMSQIGYSESELQAMAERGVIYAQ